MRPWSSAATEATMTAPVRYSRNAAAPITTRYRKVKTELGPPEEYTSTQTSPRSPRTWM